VGSRISTHFNPDEPLVIDAVGMPNDKSWLNLDDTSQDSMAAPDATTISPIHLAEPDDSTDAPKWRLYDDNMPNMYLTQSCKTRKKNGDAILF
jgi:hypothetical protein